MAYSDTEIKYYVDIITKVAQHSPLYQDAVRNVLNKTTESGGKSLSKSKLLAVYKELSASHKINLTIEQETNLLANLKKKYVRSLSGVATVTVLTMPYPCPGKCIFCPNDVRMPKSYIASEPGAQRALANKFDPYLQTYNRLVALYKNGHPTDKIELIVLGGTWTFYPENYRRWFIMRCFKALNDFVPDGTVATLTPDTILSPINATNAEGTVRLAPNYIYNEVVAKNITMPDTPCSWDALNAEFIKNELATSRCVGLSLETRPDEITTPIVLELRKLGATKIQIGVQALDDTILELNRRGHTVETTKNAFKLLRLAGFKIQAHWMPNLYGSNPQKDLSMYIELLNSEFFRPDEIKIYPCSLIPRTELQKVYAEKKWQPYDQATMVNLVVDCLKNTPRYCRVSRVIRDIPSSEISAGSISTNLRQEAEAVLDRENFKQQDIRGREVKNAKIDVIDLTLKETSYKTTCSTEFFIEFITPDDKLAGFLRLSLPYKPELFEELEDAAVIREIHVYGQSLPIGANTPGKAQHRGLGTRLIEQAELISLNAGYTKLCVISAIGTREYYRKRGFRDGALYQHKLLG